MESTARIEKEDNTIGQTIGTASPIASATPSESHSSVNLSTEDHNGSYVQFLTSGRPADVVSPGIEGETQQKKAMTFDTTERDEDEEDDAEDGEQNDQCSKRKERRRLTNRRAAQKSREKEKRKEAELIQESLEEESKRTTLRYQVKKLQDQRDKLAQFLEEHLRNKGENRCVMAPFQQKLPGGNIPNKKSWADNSAIQGKPRSLSLSTTSLTPFSGISVSKIDIDHQHSDGSTVGSTPSPNPTQVPFSSYYIKENSAVRTAQNLFQRTQSSPAVHNSPFALSGSDKPRRVSNNGADIKQNHSFIPLDQYKALALKIANEKRKDGFENGQIAKAVERTKALEQLESCTIKTIQNTNAESLNGSHVTNISSATNITNNASQQSFVQNNIMETSDNTISFPIVKPTKQTKTFVTDVSVLERFRNKNKPNVLDCTKDDQEPCTKKTKIVSNTNVESPGGTLVSYVPSVANVTSISLPQTNFQSIVLDTSKNNISDAFSTQTYTYIASEVDPSVLKEQNVNVIYLEEIPDSSGSQLEVTDSMNSQFDGTMVRVANTPETIPISSLLRTGTSTHPSILHSPDGAHSIAVSALLELNRGIVDNSASS